VALDKNNKKREREQIWGMGTGFRRTFGQHTHTHRWIIQNDTLVR
jgi:hypothetical protein